MSRPTQRPAIFLDRDGVIIENRDNDYCKSWDEVVFFRHAFDGLKRIASWDCVVVVVTNQAAVGKGILTLETATELNERILSEARLRGGRIDKAYLCPHRKEDNCDCRKPKPGMLMQAAREFNIDLSRSVMIGDALSDMQAARNAGVRGILVRSGRGERELAKLEEPMWFEVAHDLAEAVESIWLRSETSYVSTSTSTRFAPSESAQDDVA
jgi:D-glycero-D-manno-heptose 1,7-bisphosphate phosphatase